MKYAAEIVPGTMTYKPSFIKIGSSIETLMERGIGRHTDSMKIA
jgi:hypothetical protein